MPARYRKWNGFWRQNRFVLMKRNEGKYEVVDKLPKGAVLVKDYAESESVKEPAIYNRYARALKSGETPPFKIIIYVERNFIVKN